MADERIPAWLLHLDEEDHQFIKRLILASGSLKALAESYGVSYPTIRSRLDRLIDRVRAFDSFTADDPFQARVRLLVTSGELSARTAKELLKLHAASINGEAPHG